MVNFSIIQKTQLEGAMRLDAEYYQPEYLDMIKKIRVLNSFSLESIISKITQGPNPQFTDSGKICLNGRNVKDNRVDSENSNYISDREFNEFKKFKVKVGDILITLKGLGSIGKTGYVFNEVEGIFSRDIGLIRPKEEKMGKFVYAFLLSKFGDKQIERSTTGGTGQRTLATSYIKNIQIPKFSEHLIVEIGNNISESEQNYELSKVLYKQAEDLLLEELGLKDFDFEKILSSVVNFSDVLEAGRMDAEYFQPKYEKLIEKIKEKNYKIFPEVIENVPATFNPASKPEDHFKYVELSNINSSVGIIDGFSSVSGREAPGRAKRVLKYGDVIVSSVEGSLEKVALVDKEQEGYLASTGFFQLRSKNILPEVLLVMARSLIFQMQLEKHCAGTILTAVPKEAIKNVVIPILPKETQQKIADLVRQSHEARKKSKELLEEAKRKVEEMIEKGGERT